MLNRLLNRKEKFTLITSDEHRYVWFKVRKCASTTITGLLPGPNEDFSTRNYSSEKYQDYFKFAFVRNPYDRLVSNYLNKIKDQKREVIRPGFIKNLDFKEGMSFEDFALQVCDLPEEKCDRHYKSMYRVFDYENADFVGRLENFTEDMNQVLLKIVGEGAEQLPHRNKTKKSSYTEFYSDELRDRVTERYKKDLELFGYSFGD